VAEVHALPVRKFGQTSRTDAWWGPSLITFLVFTGFIIYSTWAGYSNAHYEWGPYLSPMYSPVLFGPLLDAGHFRQALFAVAALQASGLFFALHVGSRVQAPASLATAATPQ